jgi:hypothetical protein
MLVVKVPTPPTREAVPSVAVPSRNVTEPPGIPTPAGTAATELVNVTDCPNEEGFAVENSVVFVQTEDTCCVIGQELPDA